jgi:hypothetical protein
MALRHGRIEISFGNTIDAYALILGKCEKTLYPLIIAV